MTELGPLIDQFGSLRQGAAACIPMWSEKYRKQMSSLDTRAQLHQELVNSQGWSFEQYHYLREQASSGVPLTLADSVKVSTTEQLAWQFANPALTVPIPSVLLHWQVSRALRLLNGTEEPPVGDRFIVGGSTCINEAMATSLKPLPAVIIEQLFDELTAPKLEQRRVEVINAPNPNILANPDYYAGRSVCVEPEQIDRDTYTFAAQTYHLPESPSIHSKTIDQFLVDDQSGDQYGSFVWHRILPRILGNVDRYAENKIWAATYRPRNKNFKRIPGLLVERMSSLLSQVHERMLPNHEYICTVAQGMSDFATQSRIDTLKLLAQTLHRKSPRTPQHLSFFRLILDDDKHFMVPNEATDLFVSTSFFNGLFYQRRQIKKNR